MRAGAAAGDLDVSSPRATGCGDVRTRRAPTSPSCSAPGCGTGEPSPYLAHRLDAAAKLYRAGQVRVVLVTGDNSREDYDEPDAMRAYLTAARGARTGGSCSDYAGFDTWDSCVRAKKIFGVDRAVLISQGFHIRRAVALCEAAGVESYGIGVDAKHDVTWYYGGAREIFAAGKAALDAVFKPDPRFLGPEEAGVSRALRRRGRRLARRRTRPDPGPGRRPARLSGLAQRSRAHGATSPRRRASEVCARRVTRRVRGVTRPSHAGRHGTNSVTPTHCPYCALQCGMNLRRRAGGRRRGRGARRTSR